MVLSAGNEQPRVFLLSFVSVLELKHTFQVNVPPLQMVRRVAHLQISTSEDGGKQTMRTSARCCRDSGVTQPQKAVVRW